MLQLRAGDEVKVRMPEGRNNRGVMGVHLMFTTSPEAKFEGAVGVITAINPRGTHEIPQFLVDFRQHDNQSIPWQAQWFRENWLVPTGVRTGISDEPQGAAIAPPDHTAGPVHQ